MPFNHREDKAATYPTCSNPDSSMGLLEMVTRTDFSCSNKIEIWTGRLQEIEQPLEAPDKGEIRIRRQSERRWVCANWPPFSDGRR
jgi:hypothetical protein